MANYCSVSDVTLYISAGSLTDPQVTTFITRASARIDKLIGAQSTGDEVIKDLCSLMTARMISRRRPDVIKLLGTSQDWRTTMQAWDGEIADTLALYRTPIVQGSAYQHIDEDDRYQEDLPA